MFEYLTHFQLFLRFYSFLKAEIEITLEWGGFPLTSPHNGFSRKMIQIQILMEPFSREAQKIVKNPLFRMVKFFKLEILVKYFTHTN